MNAEHRHDKKDPACLEVFAKLSEFIDGELSTEAYAEIESHISDCPPCVEFVRNLKRCVEASRGIQADCRPEPIPKELEDRLKTAWTRALARKSA